MSFPGQKYALKLAVRFAFHGNMNARKLNAGSLVVGFQQCRLWRRSQIALVEAYRGVDVLEVLGCKMKSAVREPIRPHAVKISIPLCQRRTFFNQKSIFCQLANRCANASGRVLREQRIEVFGADPVFQQVKKSDSFRFRAGSLVCLIVHQNKLLVAPSRNN